MSSADNRPLTKREFLLYTQLTNPRFREVFMRPLRPMLNLHLTARFANLQAEHPQALQSLLADQHMRPFVDEVLQGIWEAFWPLLAVRADPKPQVEADEALILQAEFLAVVRGLLMPVTELVSVLQRWPNARAALDWAAVCTTFRKCVDLVLDFARAAAARGDWLLWGTAIGVYYTALQLAERGAMEPTARLVRFRSREMNLAVKAYEAYQLSLNEGRCRGALMRIAKTLYRDADRRPRAASMRVSRLLKRVFVLAVPFHARRESGPFAARVLLSGFDTASHGPNCVRCRTATTFEEMCPTARAWTDQDCRGSNDPKPWGSRERRLSERVDQGNLYDEEGVRLGMTGGGRRRGPKSQDA